MSAMPTPPDVVAAIGDPSVPRVWPTEEESGFQMKVLARKAVDDGEIKTVDDAMKRFQSHVALISSADGIVSDETQKVWVRMEQQFFRSARKYLNELKEAKDCQRK